MTQRREDSVDGRAGDWKVSRRAFLGGSVILAAAPQPGETAEPTQQRPATKRDVVFGETDHIRTYYALARM
ncbi:MULTISPECIES: hypothetical protein [unclassified Salipiger]|uniref:hypothetical protein n=1 Tax=unclassified Salipiger TaxID=2640570 RepID=UPI0013BAD6A9|nr:MULTISPECIES: hypothetical protein [unclassified Salipiger]NDV52561.1 hypothetical protein [Salipiger sp. PrR003]NDW32730.1 hypothetical protein [Salipiger sp. PrR007]